MANVKYNALTARKVATIKTPGVYVDGLGLMLRVDPKGNKRWVLRLSSNGVTRDMGLGSALEVSLAEARDRRDTIRREMRGGADPIAARNAEKQKPTFEDYARDLHEAIKGDWKNPKHAAQWLSTLETYAFPRLGKIRIDKVDARAIRDTLAPIWESKAETARRVKQRISRTLSGAIADGLRDGPNPAIDATANLGKRREPAKHFVAMPYKRAPAFFQSLPQSDMTPSARLAFQFLMVTAARTSEVLGANWPEIDEGKALWTVPGERMKGGDPHAVPLAPVALAIIFEARKISDGGPYIFPGPKLWKPFSNAVFTAALKRRGIEATGHGFRSTFRDWAEEKTDFDEAVKEMALAHKVPDKVLRAYRRTKLIEKRRDLMAQWAAFLTGGKP